MKLNDVAIPKFNGCVIQVWERSNFTSDFVKDVITNPCWNLKKIHISEMGPCSAIISSYPQKELADINQFNLSSHVSIVYTVGLQENRVTSVHSIRLWLRCTDFVFRVFLVTEVSQTMAFIALL